MVNGQFDQSTNYFLFYYIILWQLSSMHRTSKEQLVVNGIMSINSLASFLAYLPSMLIR